MRGIRAIEVTNFQSIKHARLELGQLNIIVGDNRAGKTALLRAFNAACFNATGTGFIRRGEDSCRVVIELDNGPKEFPVTIIWTKKRTGSAEYVIDIQGHQRTFSKLGASVPDEVREALGIIEIDVDKTFSIRPQIHEQMQDPFLIDRSEGQAARALAKMTKLDVVVAAQTAIRSDLRKASSEVTAATKLEKDLKNQLTQFVDLDKQVAALAEQKAALDDVQSRYEQYAARCVDLKEYEDAKQALKRLDDIPSTDEIVTRVEQFVEKVSAFNTWSESNEICNQCKTLPDVATLTERVDDLTEKATVINEYFTQQETLKDVIESLVSLGREHDEDCRLLGDIKTCPTCGQPMDRVVV